MKTTPAQASFSEEIQPLSCVVVDDEPLALSLLTSYVERTPFLTLSGAYSSGVEALPALCGEPVDVLFLDIQMPQLTGVELSRMLPATTRVVFTTAYDHYAVEGFRAGAIDYLLKPISYTDFLEAAGRALEWFRRTRPSAANLITSQSDSLFVRSEHKLVRVGFNDILIVEGLKDYVKLILRSRPRPLLTLMSMKSLASWLPASRFMRVHRSYIVNLDAVEAAERGGVVVAGRTVPVSDAFRPAVTAYIAAHSPEQRERRNSERAGCRARGILLRGNRFCQSESARSFF